MDTPINHIDEICNLSDKAMATIAMMPTTQYSMGYEYACWQRGIEVDVKQAISKLLIPCEPDYLRALIRARKGQVEVM